MATKSPNPRPSRLTASAAESLPSGRHTDPATTGLQLQVRNRRDGMSRTWLFRYRWRGEWVRLTVGHLPSMSLADARREAIACKRRIDDGIDPRRARPRRNPARTHAVLSSAVSSIDGGHTVDYLVSEFVERHLKATRKRPEYGEALLSRDVLPEWKGRDARTIKPREVIELLDKIVERGSPVAANRTAALLGQLFKFGIHRAIVETTPVQLLMRPGGKEKPKQRTLSDGELKALLTEAVPPSRFRRLAHVLQILLLTGQRRGELAAARWRHVDLKAKTWTIPAENSKNGRDQVVPLSDWAADEFRALKKSAGRSLWVLPAADKAQHVDPKLITRNLARRLEHFKARGIQAFTLHDLRRTCRTGLARLKIEPHIAERVLGHAQEKIQTTYDTHAYLDEKRAALEKWATYLGGLR